MSIRFRKPELIPTIALLVVVLVTVYLGLWQLYRLQWKQQLLAEIEKAQSALPKNLLDYAETDFPKAEWHNVFVTGKLLHNKELHATPRYLNGKLGYAVLTPLAVETHQGVRYALVNRGWVPKEKKDATTRATGNPDIRVTVEGALRSGFTQGRFTPDNRPDENLWFWYDLPAMGKATGLPLLPVLIDASAVRADTGEAIHGGPTPFPIAIIIRNDHFGYAITWFMLGLAAIGVYGAYYAERKKSC